MRNTIATLALTLLTASGCRREKTVTGVVVDFDTKSPIVSARVTARQRGWGRTESGIVWDKDYASFTETDANGRFTIRYHVGSTANLSIEKDGYNVYHTWFEPNSHATIPLRRFLAASQHMRTGFLRLGLSRASGPYGWSFADTTTGTTCATADVLPSSIDPSDESPVTLRACGDGGLLFVPAESLGVNSVMLVYADAGPNAEFTPTTTLDFRSRGGVYFVRTRDGRHFAKFEFNPSSIGATAGPDILRDFMLAYVFDPAGGRDLPARSP